MCSALRLTWSTCINNRFPAFGLTSMAALQNLNQDQHDLDSLASLIANDIYENVHEHFMVILDDYHLVEESRAVTSLINQLIQRVDENCHFVIASRTLLNLPDMTLLVARSQVGGLSFEELAFQPEEIQNLWLNNFHLSLSRWRSRRAGPRDRRLDHRPAADPPDARRASWPTGCAGRASPGWGCTSTWCSRCSNANLPTCSASCCAPRCWKSSTPSCARR